MSENECFIYFVNFTVISEEKIIPRLFPLRARSRSPLLICSHFFSAFIFAGTLQKTKENAYVRAYYCHGLSSKRIQECKHLVVKEDILLKDLIAFSSSATLYTLEIKSAKGNIFLTIKPLLQYY